MNLGGFAYPINTLWMLSCRRSLKSFNASVHRVKEAQSQVLHTVLSTNQDCAYGRHYQFSQLKHADDFRERVPVTEYEALQPWVDQICEGQSGVLTTEPVRLLEPTSGSVAGRRLIPYTNSLKRQFQNGINAWIADLYTSRPALRRGRAYWMVSPPIAAQRTAGGLKIGFADDTEYLGLTGRLAAACVMAVPPWTMRNVRTEDAPYRTLLHLLAARDLVLISVWSPSFLTNLMSLLPQVSDRLLSDLTTLIPTKSVVHVRSVLHSGDDLPTMLRRLWPQLSLISCWSDGSAAHGVHGIRTLFPHVEIQPKGIISTEAFMSFPILGHTGSALSILSHFFEFQPLSSSSDSRDTLLATELSQGEHYRVIVTTGGGLYRYQTHDVIEVTGFVGQCPLIRFRGRSNKTSDLVGEKLTEVFVASAIRRMADQLSLVPGFAMLVPRRDTPGYRLLLELGGTKQKPSNEIVAETMERLLSENPWYDHAIRVGQLQRLEATIDDRGTGTLWATYEEKCMQIGMRRGDIKPTALDTRLDWDVTPRRDN